MKRKPHVFGPVPSRRFGLSLDAADEETFEKINRPHRDLDLATYLAGLRTFRVEFSGSYRLEVFLVKGVNDSHASLDRLAKAVEDIDPDIVELNTARRLPGKEEIASRRIA